MPPEDGDRGEDVALGAGVLAEGPLAVGEAVELGLGGGEGGLLLGDEASGGASSGVA